MRKYIDALAMANKIRAKADSSDCLLGAGLLEVAAMLETAPAADIPSECHAAWKSHITARPPRPFEMATCNKCHKVFSEYSHWWDWMYCPRCGARMDSD